MKFKTKAKLNVSEVNILLYRLCVDLGFCLSPEETARLIEDTPEEIDAFTVAVFLADKFDPKQASRGLYQSVRAYIVEAFYLHHKSQNKLFIESNKRRLRFFHKSIFKEQRDKQLEKSE
jgi:hypothetical protein